MWTSGNKGGAMRTRLGHVATGLMAGAAILGLASTLACSKIGNIRAMATFKQANQAYQGQDYKKAAALYEETVTNDPTLSQVYFYLGNSYDNLYKPGLKTTANDEFIAKAVAAYQHAADNLSESLPAEAQLKRLTLQYLAAAYGADKLDDPVKEEPVLQQLIMLTPGESSNYFQLAKLYEDAGLYDDAERIFVLAKAARPDDSNVYMQLAGFYNRQGRFDKTIESLEQRAAREANNPEVFYTISTYYWDEAYRDTRLQESQKKEYVQKGIDAVDRALQIKSDYVEAIVYKGLLLRLQANLEKDAAKQKQLLSDADKLRDQAESLRKAKAAGVGE
jgi:tetratricopeptide (TPR) repeat protein